jgi:hypothetical protein
MRRRLRYCAIGIPGLYLPKGLAYQCGHQHGRPELAEKCIPDVRPQVAAVPGARPSLYTFTVAATFWVTPHDATRAAEASPKPSTRRRGRRANQ